MDSPLISVLLLLVLPSLASLVLTQRLDIEDFKNPGGWKFPKAEVISLGSTIGGLVLGLACLVVIAG